MIQAQRDFGGFKISPTVVSIQDMAAEGDERVSVVI